MDDATGLGGVESTVTTNDVSLERQFETVMETKYVPPPAMVISLIDGVVDELVKPFGPLQFQIGETIEAGIVADKFNVLPLHNLMGKAGLGGFGGLGSVKVMGPTIFEGQLDVDTT